MPPVDAPVVEPFVQPACPYCAGHRGLTYATQPGAPVRAMAAGTVTFAGSVAGVRYVVVSHADGRRATYGRLAVMVVAPGTNVVAGQVVGTASATLHIGLRQGDRYLDPVPLIGRPVGRARLVPSDGSPARAAPVVRTVCAASVGGGVGGRLR